MVSVVVITAFEELFVPTNEVPFRNLICFSKILSALSAAHSTVTSIPSISSPSVIAKPKSVTLTLLVFSSSGVAVAYTSSDAPTLLTLVQTDPAPALLNVEGLFGPVWALS